MAAPPTPLVLTRSAPPRSPPRRALVATALMFGLHALLFASWTPHVPLVKQRLGLSEGELGVALLGMALGSVASTLLAGLAIARWSSRRVALVTFAALGLCVPLVSLADTLPVLFFALFAWGICSGALGVALNAQAVVAERAYGRPALAGVHACWNLGILCGSGLGILAVSRDIGLLAQFAVLGAGAALAAPLLTASMLRADRVADPPRLRAFRCDRHLLALGVLVLAALLCEGAIADWAAVYLREHTGASTAVAGAGFTAFAVVMFLGRAAGDRLICRFGEVRVIRVLATTGAVGLGAGLIAGVAGAAVAGFAAFGAALALVVPVAFRAAGRLPGRAPGQSIAAISTLGWFGFLIGPSLISGLAELTSLPAALAVLPAITMGIAASAGTLRCPRSASPDQQGSPAATGLIRQVRRSPQRPEAPEDAVIGAACPATRLSYTRLSYTRSRWPGR